VQLPFDEEHEGEPPKNQMLLSLAEQLHKQVSANQKIIDLSANADEVSARQKQQALLRPQLNKVMSRVKRLNRKMNTASMIRLTHKVAFVFGSLIFFSFGFVLGHYPHTLFYPYYTWTLLGLIFMRFFHFYSEGMVYYLIDFCYYGNYMVMCTIMNVFSSHQDQLFKVAFLFGNGILAWSVFMFNNSLVLHRVDMLTSLGIHLFPVICMYHFKWYTLEAEAQLPKEQRNFVTPVVEDDWSEYLTNMVLWPILAYMFWLINYSLVNFVIAKGRIKRLEYDTLF